VDPAVQASAERRPRHGSLLAQPHGDPFESAELSREDVGFELFSKLDGVIAAVGGLVGHAVHSIAPPSADAHSAIAARFPVD
jgi:hypothetical protein